MHRGRGERNTVKQTPSITFLILEEPENMIKEKVSTFLQYSFALPSPSPQCPGLLQMNERVGMRKSKLHLVRTLSTRRGQRTSLG